VSRFQLNYQPACKRALEYTGSVAEDPLSIAYGAPVGEINDEWMKRHIKDCAECRNATFEASMP
jgi:hypothetical protein